MARSERQDLATVVRLRAKMAEANLATLAAARRAEVESQLSAIHKADAGRWRDIAVEAVVLVEETDARIAHICAERGMPSEFRPCLDLDWSGRGEKAAASRRAELRNLAVARIDADHRAARQRVDAWIAGALSLLISGVWTSAEVKVFLDALPTAESLLPPVRLTREWDARVSASAKTEVARWVQ